MEKKYLSTKCHNDANGVGATRARSPQMLAESKFRVVKELTMYSKIKNPLDAIMKRG